MIFSYKCTTAPDTNNYKHAVQTRYPLILSSRGRIRCITTFVHIGALTYDVSSRGGFKMLTVAEKGGGGEGVLALLTSAKILKFWQKLFEIKRANHCA